MANLPTTQEPALADLLRKTRIAIASRRQRPKHGGFSERVYTPTDDAMSESVKLLQGVERLLSSLI